MAMIRGYNSPAAMAKTLKGLFQSYFQFLVIYPLTCLELLIILWAWGTRPVIKALSLPALCSASPDPVQLFPEGSAYGPLSAQLFARWGCRGPYPRTVQTCCIYTYRSTWPDPSGGSYQGSFSIPISPAMTAKGELPSSSRSNCPLMSSNSLLLPTTTLCSFL